MKQLVASDTGHRESRARPGSILILALGGSFGAVAMAYLAMTDRASLVFGAIVAIAALAAVQRRPAAAIAVWVVLAPLVASAPTADLRKAFWLAHRALPLLALVLLILKARADDGSVRRLGRPGAIEWMIGGYLAVTVVSVLYTRSDTFPALFQVYDRIFVPLVLFILIVLIEPDEKMVGRIVPYLAIAMLGQIVIGAISWIAPGLLPGHWTTRAGERTVGSLGSPGEYSSMLLTGALLVAHFVARPARRRLAGQRFKLKQWQGVVIIVLALAMSFFTFSRASWVAAIIVGIGLLSLRPRVGRIALVTALITLLAMTSVGLLDDQLDFASRRFRSDSSEQTALSRLPVAVASLRMFQERPVTGWGYGNFDLYDRDFQVEVSGFFPQKDHVSHNVYLTIAAEQGALGLVFFLFPLLAAAWMSWQARSMLGRMGGDTRRLMIALWLALLAHIVVNNFADAQTAVGPTLWWMTLALIVSLARRAHRLARSGVPA